MEALLEKEADVESWNDERMDELSRRMDAGFEKAVTKEEMSLRFDAVDKRFDEVDRRFGDVGKRFDKIDTQLERVNDRLDFMGNTFILACAGIVAAVLANGIWG
jgi:DNA anti-recombination protein RmuC